MNLATMASYDILQEPLRVPTATVCGNYNRKGASATSGDGLETFVKSHLFPTPHGFSKDGKDHGPSGNELGRAVNQSLNCPASQRGDGESERNRNSPCLASVVVGTPTATNTLRSELFADGRSPNPREFAELNCASEQSGSLNPDWVEFLMGWPVGFTDLSRTPKMEPADWTHEHGVPRVAVGIPNRAARLTAIGNGQVPQSLAMAWKLLEQTMKYRIAASVTEAHGTQWWTVEADSKHEALRKHNAGESQFEEEEIEVTSLAEPTLDDVEELE